MSKKREPSDGFDVDSVVQAFKALSKLQDQERTRKGKALFEPVLMELRKRWAKWNGGDIHELVEVAIGGGE